MVSLKSFSFSDWLAQLGGACRRFPWAVLLLVFLTGYVMFLIHGDGKSADEKWNFFFIFYPATGSLLAVSLQLLTEAFKHRAVALITQVLVHAMWLGVSLYLTQFAPRRRLDLRERAAVDRRECHCGHDGAVVVPAVFLPQGR